MLGPDSSYSALVIHMVWKVERDDRIEAPSQLLYFRSLGANILTLLPVGARGNTLCQSRSPIPSNRVEPPESIKLTNISLRMSLSHFMTESKQYLSMPSKS